MSPKRGSISPCFLFKRLSSLQGTLECAVVRNLPSDQLRNLQDEIAVCDKKIQTIMDANERNLVGEAKHWQKSLGFGIDEVVFWFLRGDTMNIERYVIQLILILSGKEAPEGQEDGLAELALKLDVVLECCNDVCLEGKFQAHGTSQLAGDEGLQRYVKRRRLSEAIITLRAPCQIVSCLLGTMRGIHYAALSFFACRDHNFTRKELDDVCLENYWTLPTYNVSSSAGGFLANVTVKAFESECSCGGELEASPREARDSAASEMLVKLRNMAGKAL
ncbi:hypothetical protein RJ640_006556 [Escallonia rubra]|uniref:Uncharacterized protein n=1 Tax=Escallonia rubra TaxID=112253 RepID=A0AA88QHU0_9ASTE|nr:hypothetical protein RJ640_006556 [Escallonia rubra]